MCRSIKDPTFINEVDAYSPVRGMDLESAIRWNPKVEMAGCFCAQASRDHKWRNAVQAVHYALNHLTTPTQ